MRRNKRNFRLLRVGILFGMLTFMCGANCVEHCGHGGVIPEENDLGGYDTLGFSDWDSLNYESRIVGLLRGSEPVTKNNLVPVSPEQRSRIVRRILIPTLVSDTSYIAREAVDDLSRSGLIFRGDKESVDTIAITGSDRKIVLTETTSAVPVNGNYHVEVIRLPMEMTIILLKRFDVHSYRPQGVRVVMPFGMIYGIVLKKERDTYRIMPYPYSFSIET